MPPAELSAASVAFACGVACVLGGLMGAAVGLWAFIGIGAIL